MTVIFTQLRLGLLSTRPRNGPMNFRDIAKKAAEAAKEKAKEALAKAKDTYDEVRANEALNEGLSEAGKSINAALEKSGLKKIFDQAKDSPVVDAAARQWQTVSGKLETLGVNDAAREVQKAFAGLTPDDAAGILKHTYKNMSTEEAMKIGAAIVAPGGIPVYVVMKLVEYKQQQQKENPPPAADTPKPKDPSPPTP